MLCLFERDDPALRPASDAICTALQLVNFLQDAAQDWARGRLYLPRKDLAACAAHESMLAQAARDRRAPAPLRMAFARLHARAGELLHEGSGLPRALRGRAGLEIAATIAGGRRILARLERAGHDPFAQRPALGTGDWLIIAGHALALRYR
ncbi:MAG: squalene/phytoene synthase family protein [Burkholderiales bacterium]|nr:MAG: squalene/phytoene synthase family protein [Burkholderiales bacterium]